MKLEDIKIIEHDMKNRRMVEIIEQGSNESLVEFNLRICSFTSNVKYIIFDTQLTTTETSDGQLRHSVLINYNFAEFSSRLAKRTGKKYKEQLNKNMPRPKL